MSERARKVLRFFEEQKAYVDARVRSGIELYRKGTVRIRVTDAAGQPVSGAVIDAKQVTQQFKFGANTFMIDEMETSEKNEIYKTKFAEIFNLGTIPFYWNTLEPVEGEPRFSKDSPKIYRRPPIDRCVEYCLQNGIEPKLHCLNYDYYSADWLWSRSTRERKEKLAKRFAELAERYAAIIPMVEVMNESLCGYSHCSEFFWDDDFVEWSFREAQKYFPASELIINESAVHWDAPNAHTNRNPYYLQIEKLLEQHIPVHGIGLQFHSMFHEDREAETLARRDGRYCPEYLCAVMDKFEQLNLPMQITEMSIPSYTYDPEDEDIQAEILKNVYSLFFAQRSMEAVCYWNFPDGYAHLAEPGDMTCGENYYRAGLMRFDMTEKPAYKTLKKLIREDWMTDTSLVTDEEGYAVLHGFHGEYELNVHAGEKNCCSKWKLGAEMNQFCQVNL